MSKLTITEFARLGGYAAAAKMTPEQRLARSRKALAAKAAKAAARKGAK